MTFRKLGMYRTGGGWMPYSGDDGRTTEPDPEPLLPSAVAPPERIRIRYPTIAQMIAEHDASLAAFAGRTAGAPTLQPITFDLPGFSAAHFERWQAKQMRRMAKAWGVPLRLILGHS